MKKGLICREDALEVLRHYKGEFKEQYGVTKLGIFGSVARDAAKDASDVDIALKMRKPDLYYMVHIKERLEKALQTKVDLVHHRERMNPFLKERINREAVYV